MRPPPLCGWVLVSVADIRCVLNRASGAGADIGCGGGAGSFLGVETGPGDRWWSIISIGVNLIGFLFSFFYIFSFFYRTLQITYPTYPPLSGLYVPQAFQPFLYLSRHLSRTSPGFGDLSSVSAFLLVDCQRFLHCQRIP